MEQKCSLWKVLGVFFKEPIKIHFIKEISKKINLAPTSVRKHLTYLLKVDFILKKKGEPFYGFIANRDNKDFLFYKKIFNIMEIKESGLMDFIIDLLHPQAIVLYGSYFRGEDVEESDIDLYISTKIKKMLNLSEFEEILNRRIHIITNTNLKNLTSNIKTEIINGIVLYGYLKDG